MEWRWNQRPSQNSSGKPEQRDQAQRPVEHEQHDADRQHAEQRGEQPVEALVEQLGEGLDVAGQPADRLARGVALVEGQRQLLHVRGRPAGAASSSTAWPTRPERTRKTYRSTVSSDRGADHRRRRPHQRPRVAVVQQRRDGVVDADADQQRAGQPGQVLHGDGDQQQPQRPPVRAQQLAEQPAGAAAQERARRGGELVVVLGGDAAPVGVQVVGSGVLIGARPRSAPARRRGQLGLRGQQRAVGRHLGQQVGVPARRR